MSESGRDLPLHRPGAFAQGTRMARKTADLPLHSGSAPAWLFRRMVGMAGAIGTLIVPTVAPTELLRRLSDPFWFQAFGCVLGFDWHSSGVTTTVCGALKEAVRRHDLGLVVCGGKGTASRKTPDDIRRACDRTGDPADTLTYASRLVAKVDGSAVQDGYQLYHHSFFFVPGRNLWCVVQQGLNSGARYARRYHWHSAQMASFVAEPHAAVACDRRGAALNLVAGESDHHRRAIAAIGREHPDKVMRELRPLLRDRHLPLFDGPAKKASAVELRLPKRHTLKVSDLHPTVL